MRFPSKRIRLSFLYKMCQKIAKSNLPSLSSVSERITMHGIYSSSDKGKQKKHIVTIRPTATSLFICK